MLTKLRILNRVQKRFCHVTSIRVSSPRILPLADSAEFASRKRGLTNSKETSFPSLSAEISRVSANLSPTKNQIEDKNAFLRRLQQTMDTIVPGSVVSPFGSALNGFWSPNSDIDVCVQISGCRTRSLQIKALRKLASALHSITTHYIEPRFSARVPIIRWAPRRQGYLACDISVNNSIAVINSRLIGAYCRIDPRLRDLGMVIKHWAQVRGFNDRSRGTLSSFSLLLMLIHFFQKRQLLPSLQDIAILRNDPIVYCGAVDVRFAETDHFDVDDKISRGSLLVEFFDYYGNEYTEGVIGIRDLTSYPEQTGYLMVDNPFEVGKDVANVSPNQFARIRQEFRRAHSILFSGGTLEELCSRTEPPPPSNM